MSLKPVKIREETLDKARGLLQLVLKNGWSSIGANRTDRPTVTAVIDEAVNKLNTTAGEESET